MNFEWKTCFRIGVTLFILYLLTVYWGTAAGVIGALLAAATPIFIGCAVAYAVNILMSFYEKLCLPASKNEIVIRSRRPICMIAAYITLFAIIFLIIRLVLPELTACVKLILSELPGWIGEVVGWLDNNHLMTDTMAESLSSINWNSKIQQIIEIVTMGIGSVMGSVITTVATLASGLITAVLSLIFSIYLLLGKEKLASQFDRVMKRYMSRKIYTKTIYVLSVLNNCFHKYIVGQCTEAVILGVLCILGMKLLSLPYATMTGALIGFTALIPVAGAYIGAGVGAFMILTVSPIKAVVFLIFIIILQQLEGNIVYPKVVGTSMGLPAIWVLAAVTIGGGMMGIFGMVLGVPLAATAYRLVSDDVKRFEKENA
ncbi:MAG: AI-2E family transporter [Lachnospiraceae bacterium]|nr:AI-2E family transporter [Lachnospiraceae bacterium]